MGGMPSPPADLGTLLAPILPDLSVGGVLGFCAGFAVRRVGRAAIFVVGAVFVLVQLLAHYDLVSVNWGKVQSVAEPWLKTGARQGSAWLLDVLRANLPFGGAFAVGLMLGLRAR